MSKLTFLSGSCFLCKKPIKNEERIYGIKSGTATNIDREMRVPTPETEGLSWKDRKYEWKTILMPEGKMRIMWSGGKYTTKVCHKECLDTLLNAVVE